MKRALYCTFAFLLPIAACSEEVGSEGPGGGSGSGGGAPGEVLSVPVPATGRVLVELDPPAVAALSGDDAASTDWDLAFEGLDIFTNGGASGPGAGSAFGPLDREELLGDTVPEVPFMQQDAAGGAFLDWYDYDGTTHALWSRQHVYGVRDGAKLWKVQILGYYGEVAGAPVSALYQIRYAEVSASGVGPTVTAADIDATAGGLSGTDGAPGACLDLASGDLLSLTVDEAAQSSDWHLCFRRDRITVNGELGGPRGVTAVDLDAAGTAKETLEQVMARTAESTEPRFDAVTLATLADPGLDYRGDHVVSVFSDQWIVPGSSPLAPVNAAWLVVAADGRAHHLIGFEGFEDPGASAPGVVRLRIKNVK